MSDESVKTQQEEPLKYPANVRNFFKFTNDDTKEIVQWQAELKKINKGKYAGCPYIAPSDVKSSDDLQKIIKARGAEWVYDRINNSLNQAAIQSMYDSATKGPEKTVGGKDGDIIMVDWEDSIKAQEEGRVSGETIGALEEKKDVLALEMQKLIEKFDKSTSPLEMATMMTRLQKINKEVSLLNEQIEKRSEAFKARKAGKSGDAAMVPAPLPGVVTAAS